VRKRKFIFGALASVLFGVSITLNVLSRVRMAAVHGADVLSLMAAGAWVGAAVALLITAIPGLD
jgi:hypothetical protein